MDLHIICNPTSGNGTGKQVSSRILARLQDLGIDCVYRETCRPLEAIELAQRSVDEGAETLIVIGGDGTLHEAAQSLSGTGTALGIIPAGTGNDFIKTVHIPKDPLEALDMILNGSARPVDTVRINDRLFLNECGCGFDVMVLDHAENAKKHVKGLLPYLYGVLKTICHFKDISIAYSLDDGPLTEAGILVLAVGNGRFIGGGIPIAPNAVPDDGLLDVLIVSGMSRPRMLRALPGLLKGKIQTFPETVHHYALKLHLESKALRINIDGEIITMDQADIEIAPSSLLVYRP